MRANMTFRHSRCAIRAALALSLLAWLAACKVPADPEGTTDRVMGNILRVGALTDPLEAPDADAIARIAQALRAQPDVVTGDPHTLFADLAEGRLHVVAGAIPASTPFAGDIALTDPLGRLRLGDRTEDRVLAVRKGENRFVVAVNRAIRGMAQ